MANNNRKYKGSLRLDWINKDLSLYYEIDGKKFSKATIKEALKMYLMED